MIDQRKPLTGDNDQEIERAHRKQTVARSLLSMRVGLLDNAVADEVLGVGLMILKMLVVG